MLNAIILLVFCQSSHAELLKVSLLLGDTHTKTAVETVKAIKADGIGNIQIHVYPLKGIRDRDMSHLKDSKLIIINIMGRQIVEAVRPEIEEAIKRVPRSMHWLQVVLKTTNLGDKYD